MRALALVLLFYVAPALAAEPRVEYTVDLARAHAQLITVEMTLRDVEAGDVELVMPTWRPGRYEIIDPSGTVRRFAATDGQGDPLAWEKVRKNAWSVRTPGGTVRARYEIYANSIGNRTRYADDTHAFLSGSAVFLWNPPRRDETAIVRLINAPKEWVVATGLEAPGADPRVLLAPNYDVLVDSPIEIGVLDTTSFEFEGATHEIAIWGEGDWDLDALARDFEMIVADQHRVFGELPYQRYVFLLHVGPGLGGGTEHLNSTIMQTRPGTFDSKSSYQGFLGLVSHEFFHTWNVKQLRPAGIHPYDYERENYTKLLWVAEGTTSYYDDLSLVRTGLIDTDEYFKRIGSAITSLRRSSGRKLQNLEESSFDAWVKFNKRTPDSGNTTISFYSKGALVSLLLDLELRSRSRENVTLDDVMRALYKLYPLSGPGFTPEDVVNTCGMLTGEDFTGFFDANVSGIEDLNFEPPLEWAGVKLHFKHDKAPWSLGLDEPEDESSDDADDESEEDETDDDGYDRISLGLSLTKRDANVYIRYVKEGGACFDAGLIVDDELIAINGRRMASTDVKEALEDIEAGEEITLLTSRRGVLTERRIVARAEPAGSWKLKRVKDPTPEQKARYESWLGQPWPGDESDDDSDESETP